MLSYGGRYISALDVGEKESDPELRELHERRVRRKPRLGHAHRHRGSDEFGHRGMGPLRRRDFWTSREQHLHHLRRRRPCARDEVLLGEVLHPYLYYCVVLSGTPPAQTFRTTSIVSGGLGGKGSGASHAQGHGLELRLGASHAQ